MKYARLSYLLIAVSLMISTISAKCGNQAGDEYNGIKLKDEKVSAAVTVPIELTIYPEKTIKPYSSKMFGATAHMTPPNNEINNVFLDKNSSSDQNSYPVVAEDVIELLKKEGFKMPLVHLFGCGLTFKWKEQLGKINERPKGTHGKVLVGLVEYIKLALAADPDAEFTVYVNMKDESPDSIGELIQFFKGDANTSWGKKRVAMGLEAPVKVTVWNIDGEYDWQGRGWSMEQYIEEAQKHIATIRKLDPEAKISAQAATAPWAESQKDKWRSWNKAVLNALAKDIDYISFHPYYHGLPVADIANGYMDKMLEDIKNSPNPNVKIFISEYGAWPPGSEKKDWRKYWFWTHALKGCLATSEWINVMLNRPDVGMMCYHSFNAGPWKLIGRGEKNGKAYVTGIVDILKLYQQIPGERIVKTDVTGKYCNIKAGQLFISAASITGKDGKIYLFLNNRSTEITGEVKINIDGTDHEIESITTVSAPELSSFNTSEERPIKTIEGKAEDSKKPQIELPPQSTMRLKIRPVTISK